MDFTDFIHCRHRLHYSTALFHAQEESGLTLIHTKNVYLILIFIIDGAKEGISNIGK